MHFLMVLINLFICLIFWIVFFYSEKKCIELNDEIELKECFLSGLPFLSYKGAKALSAICRKKIIQKRKKLPVL